MVISTRIQVTGLVELTRDMQEAAKEIETAISRAFKTVGWLITKEIKKETPVDTGRLRRSITPIFKQMMVEILSNVDYAVYVEEGTRNMKGAHMFKKVIDRMQDRIPEMLLREIKRRI